MENNSSKKDTYLLSLGLLTGIMGSIIVDFYKTIVGGSPTWMLIFLLALCMLLLIVEFMMNPDKHKGWKSILILMAVVSLLFIFIYIK